MLSVACGSCSIWSLDLSIKLQDKGSKHDKNVAVLKERLPSLVLNLIGVGDNGDDEDDMLVVVDKVVDERLDLDTSRVKTNFK